MNIQQAFKSLDVFALTGITGHFIGKHGIGKSSIIKQYSALRDYTYVEIRVGLMADAGDLTGIQEFVKCKLSGKNLGTEHVLPTWFMQGVSEIGEAAKSGKKVLIFLDEINRGHKDILQAIFELILDYSLKGVKLAPGSMVVAASNPPTDDYSVLDFTDAAFTDRMCHIMLEPTIPEFLSYAQASGMDSGLYEFLREHTHHIEEIGKPYALDFVKPSRRSYFRADAVIKACEKLNVQEVELELLCGLVGFEAAKAMTSFRETHIKSIKAVEVLNSYSVNEAVRNTVTKAIEKGRGDMLGTLNEDLVALLEKMEGLTQLQADNLADLVHDLPIELAYALAIKLTSNGQNRAIMSIDGKTPGLYAHEKFVARINYIKEERLKIKALSEKTTKAKKK
jgi:hypothetical protein